MHIARLEAVARKLCRNPAAASDLVQDTLERAWRCFESLHDDTRARGWVLQILRNTWLDQLRHHRVEVPIEEIHEPSYVADEPAWWEGITIREVRHAIERLEEPFRSVAVLHDLEGHSYREIARLLGIPNATAATRLHRAHARIRELLHRELGASE